ncbi:hypothetical protein ACTFIR_011875 [Dictyostelium discoideum]
MNSSFSSPSQNDKRVRKGDDDDDEYSNNAQKSLLNILNKKRSRAEPESESESESESVEEEEEEEEEKSTPTITRRTSGPKKKRNKEGKETPIKLKKIRADIQKYKEWVTNKDSMNDVMRELLIKVGDRNYLVPETSVEANGKRNSEGKKVEPLSKVIAAYNN